MPVSTPQVASGISGILGPVIGAIGQSSDVQQGMQDYQNQVQQGTNTLQAGQTAANAAFSPYTAAGATGVNGELSAIQGRTQAPNAAVTDNSAQNAIANYLNPSAAYSINQADNAIQAAGIAGGAVGGGMEKALSNNANQMAQTNYNDAYSQMLAGNNLTNTQQNTNAQNTNAYNQQQIGNFGNLASQGSSATAANQSLDANYNNGINANYGEIAVDQQAGQNSLGSIFNNASTATGNNVMNGITNMFGIGG